MIAFGILGIADAVNVIVVCITAYIVYNDCVVQDQVIRVLHFNSCDKSPIVSACKSSHIDEIADYVNLCSTIVVLGIYAYIRTEIEGG